MISGVRQSAFCLRLKLCRAPRNHDSFVISDMQLKRITNYNCTSVGSGRQPLRIARSYSKLRIDFEPYRFEDGRRTISLKHIGHEQQPTSFLKLTMSDVAG